MTREDLIHLSTRLHALYGERFAGLTPGQASVWFNDLRSVDPEVIDQAVLRWVRQHHVGQVPTLQNLCDMVELVENDWRAAQISRPPTLRQEPEATLRAAAANAPPGLRDWAQGHVELVLAGLGRPSNHAETAARCREFAARWPEDEAAWEQAALWWERGTS